MTFRGCRVSNCFGNPKFRDFALHQDLIETLKDGNWKERLFSVLWSIFADYGRSPVRLFGWAVFLIVYFGWNFYYMKPGSFNVNEHGLPADNFWTYIYYSVVTFTTLGFGDVIPTTFKAARWVMAEVILGYVTLGVFVSILASVFTRKS